MKHACLHSACRVPKIVRRTHYIIKFCIFKETMGKKFSLLIFHYLAFPKPRVYSVNIGELHLPKCLRAESFLPVRSSSYLRGIDAARIVSARGIIACVKTGKKCEHDSGQCTSDLFLKIYVRISYS
jgi:hypothetical protein